MRQSDTDPDAGSAPGGKAVPRRILGRKAEDTAEGCRAMAEADHVRAGDVDTDHMRFRMEQSADAWTKRADLLERLEASFSARNAQHVEPDDDEGDK